MAAADPVSVNVATFLSRLARLHEQLHANKDDAFKGAPSLLILHGKERPIEVGDEPRSVTLQKALLGYQFPDTIIFLAGNKLYVHASPKKLSYLRPSADEASRPGAGYPFTIELVERLKGDDNNAVVDTLVAALTAAGNTVAHLPDDSIEGSPVAAPWMERLRSVGAGELALVDGTAGVDAFLAVQDAAAQGRTQKLGHLAARICRNVFGSLYFPDTKSEKKADKKTPKPVATNASIASDVTKSLDVLPLTGKDPETGQVLNPYGFRADTSSVSWAVGPLVQSGGRGNVHVAKAVAPGPDGTAALVVSSADRTREDVVHYSAVMGEAQVMVGIARTYFVGASPSQIKVYDAILEAQTMLIDGLRPGAVIGTVVAQVENFLLGQSVLQQGEIMMSRKFGDGAGFRLVVADRYQRLHARSTTVVEEGMAFFVCVGVSNIPIADTPTGKDMQALAKAGTTYSVVIGDTVVVRGDGPLVVTDKAPSDRQQVFYEVAEEDGDADADVAMAVAGAGTRSTRSAHRKAEAEADEESRRRRDEHQALLRQKKIEAGRRMAAGGAGADGDKKDDDALASAPDVVAYSAPADMPRGVRQNQISIDKTHDAVLLPLFGTLVPFHVSTIKTLNKTEEGPKAFLRINFYSPGQATGKDVAPSMAAALARFPEAAFIRTLSFMSRNHANMENVVNTIKAMQKRAKTEREAEAVRADIVEQSRLVITKDAKVPRLSDLHMWPAISGRKTQGTLEAHTNGFRFVSAKGEKVEIIYGNIKHGIFQPCDKEHLVLIHFHLKHAIMIGKKKYRDIQFFTEVVAGSTAVDGRFRSEFDADELQEEERERRIKLEMNKAFRRFVQRCEEVAEKDAGGFKSFEIPTRDLAFSGTPQREMVDIYPCADCLVSLVEKPPFVASVRDIDHVHFERVSFSHKNFDMVLIFKAGAREKGEEEYARISSIPMASLDAIKGWLDGVADLTYSESVHSFTWKTIIQDIVRDEAFWLAEDPDTGEEKPVGYDFLGGAVGEEEDEDEEEEESDYEGEEGGSDDDDADEEEEDDDDDDFDDAVTDEDDDDGDDDDDDEDGDDWDELEKKAEEADRKRKLEDDEDDARDRRKHDKKTAKRPRRE